MTNEDAIILLKDCVKIFEKGKDRTAEKALVYLEQHIEALNMAIYALAQIPPVTEEAKRMTNKEAIKYLIPPVATSTEPSAEYLKQKEAYDLAIKALKERPQGEWEHIPDNTNKQRIVYKCSVCGRIIDVYYREDLSFAYPFCHCGADMRGEEE